MIRPCMVMGPLRLCPVGTGTLSASFSRGTCRLASLRSFFALAHLRDGSSRWCCCESCHEELLLPIYVFTCWFPPVVGRLRRNNHGRTSPRPMHTKTSRIGACRPSTSAGILSSSTALSCAKIDTELVRDPVVSCLLQSGCANCCWCQQAQARHRRHYS